MIVMMMMPCADVSLLLLLSTRFDPDEKSQQRKIGVNPGEELLLFTLELLQYFS